MKKLRYSVQQFSYVTENMLVIEVLDEGRKLVFNLSLDERSGEIQFRIGNSITTDYIEVGELIDLINEQTKVLRDWAEDVRD